MDLSIVIINYKTPEILSLCISSLKSTIKNIKYEIIAVDVESDYKIEYFIKDKFPDVVFLPIKDNVGYSKSVNRGIGKADKNSKYFLVLNADIITKEDAINRMFDFMEQSPDVGVSGPQLLNFNNTFQNSCFQFYTPEVILYRRTFFKNFTRAKKVLDSFLMAESNHDLTQNVDWMSGAALFIRGTALKKIGLMDERFFMYFEDVDWCRRFWDNGYRVAYYPNAKMMHYHGKQSSDSKKYAFIHIVSAVKYFWKYLGQKMPDKDTKK